MDQKLHGHMFSLSLLSISHDFTSELIEFTSKIFAQSIRSTKMTSNGHEHQFISSATPKTHIEMDIEIATDIKMTSS